MKNVVCILSIVILSLSVKSQGFDKKDSVLINYFSNIGNHLSYFKQPPVENILFFDINTHSRNREIYFSKLTDTMYVGIAKNLKGISPLRDKKFKEYDYKYFVFDTKNTSLYLFSNKPNRIDTLIFDKNIILMHNLLTARWCNVYNKMYFNNIHILIKGKDGFKSTSGSDIVDYHVNKKEGDTIYRNFNAKRRYHGKYLEDCLETNQFVNYFNDIILNNKNPYFDSDKVEWKKIDYSIYITKRAERISKKCK